MNGVFPPGYRPFIDPVNLHQQWYLLLIPMALLLALAYKSVRVVELRELPKQALVMAAQIVFGMIALGFGAYLLVQYVAPRIIPL